MESIKEYFRRNSSFYSSAVQICLLATAIKILLIPSYHSTDFEVHRNWLAITHSLPHEKWYYEDTSIWTLDYPPFFAWFEYFLSKFAVYFDSKMLDINNLNYESEATVLFQRFSVIVMDIVFFLGVYAYCSTWPTNTTSETCSSTYKKEIVFAFCVLSPALFMIDHIHFQYNGFLIGLYLLSIALIRMNQDLLSAVVFSILLNFKHIFMYQAPVYFVYLLLHYCYIPDHINELDVQYISNDIPDDRRPSEAEVAVYTYPSKSKFSFRRFCVLAFVVLFTFGVSFLPFLCPTTSPLTVDSILTNAKQLFSRLFPFKRGLIHTYWAPNFWALYTFFDNILTVFANLNCKYTGVMCSVPHHMVGTSGLTGDISFNVLPNIPSYVTFILTILFMIPCLIPIMMHPHPRLFVNCLITCSFISFLFGWHVHEKAALTILLPILITACDTALDARIAILFSTITHISFFPLLYKPQEWLTKVLFAVIYYYALVLTLDDYHKKSQKIRKIKQEGIQLGSFDIFYLYCLLFVAIYSTCIHPLIFKDQYEFLPLMLISVTCACGVIYCFFLSLISSYKKNDIVHTYLTTPSPSDTSEMESEFE